jgi:CheY-like chemotaxis protein
MNSPFENPSGPETIPATAETILVVDDLPELRLVASLLLQRCGYRVLTANSGEHAKKIARENPNIDLLLTDVEMPGMLGDQLAEWFRVTRPHTAVVFMSGNPMQQRRLDRSYFVEKPFIRLDALVATIREALRDSRSTHHSTSAAA